MANFLDKFSSSIMPRHELTEVERVEQNMAQIELEIQQKFTQLGTMFYRDYSNKDDLGENYQEMIEQIKKLDENRKGFYAHKMRLEGNMMCLNCGEIIPNGSVYCAKCGKKADEKEI